VTRVFNMVPLEVHTARTLFSLDMFQVIG